MDLVNLLCQVIFYAKQNDFLSNCIKEFFINESKTFGSKLTKDLFYCLSLVNFAQMLLFGCFSSSFIGE